MKKLIFLLLCVIAVGCDNFEEVEAPFVVYNLSDYPGKLVVNGVEKDSTIFPGESAFMRVKVRIPKSDNISDVDDEETLVTVSFRNIWTGKLIEPEECYSGAKTVTTVTIRSAEDRWHQIECRESR